MISEVEYRVAILKGKKRRLFPRLCLGCEEKIWCPTYSRQKYCTAQCCLTARRSNWTNVDRDIESYCSECKSIKSRDEFRKNVGRSSGVQAHCKICEDGNKRNWYIKNADRARRKNRERRAKNKQIAQDWIVNYLLTHPCVDCAESDIIVLDFDHVRGKKKCHLAQMISSGVLLEKIIEEVGKCVIRCANCHRRKTSKDFFHWKSKRSVA